jgi:hypothetical protein
MQIAVILPAETHSDCSVYVVSEIDRTAVSPFHCAIRDLSQRYIEFARREMVVQPWRGGGFTGASGVWFGVFPRFLGNQYTEPNSNGNTQTR